MALRARLIGGALLFGGLAAAASGCAVVDTGSFERLQNEMAGVKRDVAALKAAPPSSAASPSAARPENGEIQALRKNYADLNNDFDRLRTDLLANATKVEEARGEMQKIANRQNEIERRLAAQEAALAKPGVPAAAGEPPPEWKTPEEMYDYGVGQVKGENPKKGREVLSAFVSKYPAHKLVPNALYWKGEAFYAEKDYENAILAFQDVVDKYPSGDKAADAMYKQGLSFLALKDKKNARILLELVSSKYPKSKAAEMAKKKLSEIN